VWYWVDGSMERKSKFGSGVMLCGMVEGKLVLHDMFDLQIMIQHVRKDKS